MNSHSYLCILSSLFLSSTLLCMERVIPEHTITIGDNIITIRQTLLDDFQEIGEISTRSFAGVYGLTTQEQINDYKQKNDSLFAEEKETFIRNRTNMVSLVALCNGKITGFLSTNLTDDAPDELYGRELVIDPTVQKQGIGKLLITHCLRQLPTLKRAVCMTNKKNHNAQAFYKHFKGKEIDVASFQKYLYAALDPANYVGFEFGQAEIQALREENSASWCEQIDKKETGDKSNISSPVSF